MWKSIYETGRALESLRDLERLARLFSLSCFWMNIVYPENYQADELWLDLLVVAKTDDSLPGLASIKNGVPEPDFLLALFCTFYHHNIFFDWEHSNIDGIRTLLEREILQERIRLPYRFGRLLYDRFNDVHHSSRTDHLLAPDVRTLLEGSPQGVYQAGNYISGPLGIIEGQEARWTPPTLQLPLWHCSDTGCNALHTVGLVPPTIPLVEAYRDIHKLLQDRLGPASEWYPALSKLHREDRWKRGRRYHDLPVALANCFVDGEREKILTAALASPHGNALRTIVARPPRSKEDSQGPPAQIAASLSPAAVLQLLLTLKDQCIVEITDSLIEEKRIRLPVGERRLVRARPPRVSVRDSRTEVSGFGLRSSQVRPIVYLSAGILRAYTKCGLVNELEWRVGRDPSSSVEEAVLQFVRQRGPRDALRDLILSSQAITKEICAECDISIADGLRVSDRMLDCLMWKLGFDPEQYDDALPRFHARLREFEERVLEAAPIDSEDDRERVRSAGVNLFVSVEDFVERLVTYNVWLLAGDHFVEYRFIWDLGKARHIVPSVLGEVLPSGGVTHVWSSEGENSLGVLLRYLTESRKWMNSLDTANRSDLLRPEDDLPHYADDLNQPFPFRHYQLWADTDITQLRRYREGYIKIVTLLEQADLAVIRNGLDHYRNGQRFPDSDKMLACASRLRQALDLADVNRYIPKIYWLYTTTSDRFGFIDSECRDYAGRRFVVRGPTIASGLPPITADQPIVVAPCNLLGYPNSTLVFHAREASEYLQYWDGYPRRRKIPPPKLVLQSDQLAETEPVHDE